MEETQKISQSQHKFLQSCTYDDVDFFMLKNWRGYAKVVKIYDGDTFTVIVYKDNDPYKIKIRLAHIDTAEKRSDNPKEVEIAEKTREFCEKYVGDGMIWLDCHGNGKYGRTIADVYKTPNDTESLNSLLIKEGLAYKYEGGSRSDFSDWYISH